MISNQSFLELRTTSDLSFLSKNTYTGSVISDKPRDPARELRTLMSDFACITNQCLVQQPKISKTRHKNSNDFDVAINKLKQRSGHALESTINSLMAELTRVRTEGQNAVKEFCKKLFGQVRESADKLVTRRAFEILYPLVLRGLQSYRTNDGDLATDLTTKLKLQEESDITSTWNLEVTPEPSRELLYKKNDMSQLSRKMPSMIINLKNPFQSKLDTNESKLDTNEGIAASHKFNQIKEIELKVDDAVCNRNEAYPRITNAYFKNKEALRSMEIKYTDGSKYSYDRERNRTTLSIKDEALQSGMNKPITTTAIYPGLHTISPPSTTTELTIPAPINEPAHLY